MSAVELLTPPQLAMLRKIRDGKSGPSGAVEFVCATRSELSTVKALARRNLVCWRHMATRLFAAALTKQGRRSAEAHSMIDGVAS